MSGNGLDNRTQNQMAKQYVITDERFDLIDSLMYGHLRNPHYERVKNLRSTMQGIIQFETDYIGSSFVAEVAASLYVLVVEPYDNDLITVTIAEALEPERRLHA